MHCYIGTYFTTVGSSLAVNDTCAQTNFFRQGSAGVLSEAELKIPGISVHGAKTKREWSQIWKTLVKISAGNADIFTRVFQI